jgi:hypothetical protein
MALGRSIASKPIKAQLTKSTFDYKPPVSHKLTLIPILSSPICTTPPVSHLHPGRVPCPICLTRPPRKHHASTSTAHDWLQSPHHATRCRRHGGSCASSFRSQKLESPVPRSPHSAPALPQPQHTSFVSLLITSTPPNLRHPVQLHLEPCREPDRRRKTASRDHGASC